MLAGERQRDYFFWVNFRASKLSVLIEKMGEIEK
jgi:hypothetical protein